MTRVVLPHPLRPPFPFPVLTPAPASTELPPATLGGAVGCDFRGSLNQLLFVEYSGNLSRMNLAPSPGYAVLGTGYDQPEDVKASADGVHAYVTERSGDLVRVDLTCADRGDASVVASGMTAPQQMFLDEANTAAYTVEYTIGGRLWQIDLVEGTMTAVLSGLQNAVGVALTSDRQYAYISEQLTGTGDGRISRFKLSNGAREDVATGLTAPFFLTWLDASETTLLVTERDPANRLRSVNVVAGTSVIVAAGLPARPSSVAVASPGTLLVCCDDVIDEIFVAAPGNQPDGPLLEGIGWVPFDWVTSGGLADTTGHDPSYFYQVHDAPFGGTLPVMVNFAAASALSASWYQVAVDGAVRTDVFNGAQWNGTEFLPATNSPQSLGGQPGFYPVYTAAEAELWTALPGCYLDSTNLASAAHHTITVTFFDETGMTVLGSATPLDIYVDNEPCTGTLTEATIDGTPATPCGFLQYTDASEDVSIGYTAAQPQGNATYGISVFRGVTPITGVFASGTSGPVTSTSASLPATTVEALLGFDGNWPPCVTAGFAVYLYVSASAQTGWSRCSQYDASAAEAFMLSA